MMGNTITRLFDKNPCYASIEPTLPGKYLAASFRFSLFYVVLLLIGCSTTQLPAPVVDRAKTDGSGLMGKSSGSEHLAGQYYTVQKGDTLSGIALKHNVSLKKLIEWNNIADPGSIKPGQRINLSMPLPASGDSQPELFALSRQPMETTIEQSAQSGTPSDSAYSERPAETAGIVSGKIKTGPKAFKLPFSGQNAAQPKYPESSSAAKQVLPPDTVAENKRIETAPQPGSSGYDESRNSLGVDWMWPTTGKLLSGFSKDSKGVKISGETGQPVLASAGGEVVYSGHGLRGYGNLVIIKHDDTFLSAYAHNSKILVKEGDSVAKGQKIAEMGNTDTDTTQLHFEIRKNGKPVDPLQYLPNQS